MNSYLVNWAIKGCRRNKINISGGKFNNFAAKLQRELYFLYNFTCVFQRLGNCLLPSVTTDAATLS